MSFWSGRKPNFVGTRGWTRLPGCLNLGSVEGRGVHQHDRDVVLNGVNAPAFTAFQTRPVRVENDRLLADRANQHGQQIRGDHNGSIVARAESTAFAGMRCDRIAFQIQGGA